MDKRIKYYPSDYFIEEKTTPSSPSDDDSDVMVIGKYVGNEGVLKDEVRGNDFNLAHILVTLFASSTVETV